MQSRTWIRSGVSEEIDARQERLNELVLSKIRHYYQHLYLTKECYRYPLSLSRLMQLTKRNSYAVMSAVRFLSNSIPSQSNTSPPISYDRIPSDRNRTHRPYRIFLKSRSIPHTPTVCNQTDHKV